MRRSEAFFLLGWSLTETESDERFHVWGYTDEEPESETILAKFHTSDAAVRWVERNNMVTAVVDYETDQEVWNYTDRNGE